MGVDAMWRLLAVVLLGGILGTGFGVGLGFFLFLYIFPPPPATEALAADGRTAVIARGTFIHADPNDPITGSTSPISSVRPRADTISPQALHPARSP